MIKSVRKINTETALHIHQVSQHVAQDALSNDSTNSSNYPALLGTEYSSFPHFTKMSKDWSPRSTVCPDDWLPPSAAGLPGSRLSLSQLLFRA